MSVLPAFKAALLNIGKLPSSSLVTTKKEDGAKTEEIDENQHSTPSSTALNPLFDNETKKNEAGINDSEDSFVFVDHNTVQDFQKSLNHHKTLPISDDSNKLKSEQNNGNKGFCEVIWKDKSSPASLIEALDEPLPGLVITPENKTQFAWFSKEKLTEVLQSITLEQLADLRADIACADISPGRIPESDPRLDAVNRAVINEAADRSHRALLALDSSHTGLSHLITLAETLQMLGKYVKEKTLLSILDRADNFLKSKGIQKELAICSPEKLQQLEKLLPMLKTYGFDIKPVNFDDLRNKCVDAAHNFSKVLINSTVSPIYSASPMIKALHTLAISYEEFSAACKEYGKKIDGDYKSFVIESLKSLDKNQKKALAHTLRTDGIDQLEQQSKAAIKALAKLHPDKSKLLKAIVDSLDAALGWTVSLQAAFARFLRSLKKPISYNIADYFAGIQKDFSPYIESLKEEFGVIFEPNEKLATYTVRVNRTNQARNSSSISSTQELGYTSQVTAGHGPVPKNIFKMYQDAFDLEQKRVDAGQPRTKEILLKGVSFSEQAYIDWKRNCAADITIGSIASKNHFVLNHEDQPAAHVVVDALKKFCGDNEKERISISHCLSQGTSNITCFLYMLGNPPIITLPRGETISSFNAEENDSADYTLSFNVSRRKDGKARIEFTHIIGNKPGEENKSESLKRRNIQFAILSSCVSVPVKPESFVKVKANLIVDEDGKVTVERPITYEYDLIPA